MKPLLLLLTAGLLCNMWPFSNRPVQRNGNDSADIPMTTMDSLEAHVWRTAGSVDNGFTCEIFRNDTIFSRTYHSPTGQWSNIACEPFYLYNPLKSKDIVFTDLNEPVQFFNPRRMGKKQNGHFIIYRQHVYDTPEWIITRDCEITALTDTTLTLSETQNTFIGSNAYTAYYVATDMPFPWDEQVVQRYDDRDFYGPLTPSEVRKEKRRVRKEIRREAHVRPMRHDKG